MLEVSEAALEVLSAYLHEQNINSAVRITPMAGNCAGPHLRIKASEARANDQVFERSGITFLVNKELLAECGQIHIEYAETGTSCCCSGGCAGFRISGAKKYPFSGRCVTEPNRCDNGCAQTLAANSAACSAELA